MNTISKAHQLILMDIDMILFIVRDKSDKEKQPSSIDGCFWRGVYTVECHESVTNSLDNPVHNVLSVC